VWVPENAPPESTFTVHLAKKNPFGRKPQGGLTLQVRVRKS
jgi:hypothetical protein